MNWFAEQDATTIATEFHAIAINSDATSLRAMSPVQRYFMAQTRDQRRDALQHVPKDNASVLEALTFVVNHGYDQDEDHAISLLGAIGWSTFAFACQRTSARPVHARVYSNLVWEILAQSLVTADDVDSDLRTRFLENLATNYERGAAVNYAAADALESLLERLNA
jgi:hypothetical protein